MREDSTESSRVACVVFNRGYFVCAKYEAESRARFDRMHVKRLTFVLYIDSIILVCNYFIIMEN